MTRRRLFIALPLIGVFLLVSGPLLPARAAETRPVIVEFLGVPLGASARTIFETWGVPDNQTLLTSTGGVRTVHSDSSSVGKGRRKILQYRKQIRGETMVLNGHLNSNHRLFRIWGLVAKVEGRKYDTVWNKFRDYLLQRYPGIKPDQKRMRGTTILFLRDPVKHHFIRLIRTQGEYPIQIQVISGEVRRR